MARGYAAVCLCGTKHDANFGGALRAVTCYDASLVILVGSRLKRRGAPADTTHAWKHVPVISSDDPFITMPYGCVPVAVELIAGARSLPGFTHPERAMYVFGPEDSDVPAHIIDRCAHVISVPTRVCMNLAATVNVVLYDRLMKQLRA